jgi:hypothetical protein
MNDLFRKSDEQNIKDFEESKKILREAVEQMKKARSEQKEHPINSRGYAMAELQVGDAWAKIAVSSLLGWPYIGGSEFDTRLSNYRVLTEAVDYKRAIYAKHFM